MIACGLLLTALLLWGLLLVGLDAVDRQRHDAGRRGSETPAGDAQGCYYVSSDSQGVVDSPLVYQER